MKIQITGLHINITESLNDFITKKIRKLKKYNEKLTEADIIISVEKKFHIVRAMLYGKNLKFKCEERSKDMYESINGVVNKLEKRLRKQKSVKKDHSRQSFRWVEHQIFNEGKNLNENKYEDDIIEVENFELKPMKVDEAVEQLKIEKSKKDKNNFIVFIDSDTNKFSVLYERRDKKFGLIQPE